MDRNKLQFLTDLVQQRKETQDLLLDLLKIAVHEDKAVARIPEFNSMFQLVVGATFSLWRAIVLAQTPITPLSALKHAELLLERLVAFNAILFPDEKDTKTWMCGFYISNIQYRLWHLYKSFASQLEVDALSTFIQNWSPLTFTHEEATLPTFDEQGPFKTKAFFTDTLSVLSLIAQRIHFLANG